MQVTNLTDSQIDSSTILDRAKGRGSSILGIITSNAKIGVGIVVVASLPPSSAHILGTTSLGQDMFAQIVYGARVSLVVGFFAATGSTMLQVSFGLTSA